VVSIQQKRGWTVASLNGTGIHPLPPGALATVSRVGTRGAPTTVGDQFWCSTERVKLRSAIAL
jgi:hypothetical protein